MCVYGISETKILKKDTYFYKLVKESEQPSVFLSPIKPKYRYMQFQNQDFVEYNTGTLFSYEIGKEITSDFDTTPGMYCYITEKTAKEQDYWKKLRLLKVLVKKGSKIRYAYSSYFMQLVSIEPDVVLIETLTPVEVIA